MKFILEYSLETVLNGYFSLYWYYNQEILRMRNLIKAKETFVWNITFHLYIYPIFASYDERCLSSDFKYNIISIFRHKSVTFSFLLSTWNVWKSSWILTFLGHIFHRNKTAQINFYNCLFMTCFVTFVNDYRFYLHKNRRHYTQFQPFKDSED